MLSKNHLSITGVIVTDVTVAPDSSYAYFTIVHPLGSRNAPLYLRCFAFGKGLESIHATLPRKGMAVCITAYLRSHRTGINAVIKTLKVIPDNERTGVTFEHIDTGQVYEIPEEQCKIDEFKVNGNVLILSTGECVAFNTTQYAENAYVWFQECFRDGCHKLFIQESADLYWYE